MFQYFMYHEKKNHRTFNRFQLQSTKITKMSPRNAMKLFRLDARPSLGNLLKPVNFAIRRFSNIIEEKERAEEMIFVRKREEQILQTRQKELEREIKAIYSGFELLF